ncbi:TetR family transcriptional regulator [Pelagerythrobacter marinus]|uniref:TetR family transcriptional regulator n=1 Tax=Pelagerythrobacter marinus TaxID=538382 RepID=UPI002036ACAC|nr:TetR family transcriptional regulator [Pelagerythrobacter marinus]USA40725.1 TetR family transcriptional regulator [Pelagerythrobacter marinus]WPZ08102.1 TetR family transcriptional regulator [Pelagerythrobacter marinus]
MPRPPADVAAVRARMVDEAERMLVESGGRRLVLSDLARRVGMSQSYAHRFFPTKADLVRALAGRWFREVEARSAEIAALDLPGPERLERWVLALLALKRERHDADPAVFEAYLALAADHMDLVGAHTARLTDDLARIVAAFVPADEVEQAVQVVEDATMPFRVPFAIARFRARATDARARAVVAALVRALAPG